MKLDAIRLQLVASGHCAKRIHPAPFATYFCVRPDHHPDGCMAASVDCPICSRPVHPDAQYGPVQPTPLGGTFGHRGCVDQHHFGAARDQRIGA